MSVLFDVSQLDANLDTLLAYTYPPVDISPSLLIPDIRRRAAHKSVLQSTLLDISATRAAVQSIQTKIARLEVGLRFREESLKRATSPVSALPVELLREIFILDHNQPWQFGGTGQRLAQVCAQWRSVALGIQKFWNNITIGPKGADGFAELATRSGRLPLYVTLYPIRTGTLVIDEENASRISHLSLVGEQTPLQTVALDRCAAHFSLEWVSFERREETLVDARPIAQIHPGLTSAKFLCSYGSAFYNPDDLVLPRVETLVLGSMSYRDVCESLRSFYDTHFERLRLDHIDAGRQDQHLSVIVPQGMESSFDSLDLTKAAFSVFVVICHTWMMGFLKSLTLREILGPEDEEEADERDSGRIFRALFLHAPNITSLDLELDNLVYIPFTFTIADATVLPKLESLVLAVLDDILEYQELDMKSILQIVEGRSPHPKLKLLRVSPELVYDDDEIEKVKELVEVFGIIEY